jgi:hypothetical protein
MNSFTGGVTDADNSLPVEFGKNSIRNHDLANLRNPTFTTDIMLSVFIYNQPH